MITYISFTLNNNNNKFSGTPKTPVYVAVLEEGPPTLLTFNITSSNTIEYNQTITIRSPGFNLYIPNVNNVYTPFSTGTATVSSSPSVKITVSNETDSLWSLGFLEGPCLHGGSLIQTPHGLKRIDQLTNRDQVLTPNHTYAQVKEVVLCGRSFPGSSTPHQAVILEPDALAPGVPNHRLVIDPGHPISPHLDAPLKPAGSYLSSTDSKIHLGSWGDPTEKLTRYDLVLEEGYSSYLANNVIVQSRKAHDDAGYEHWYQGIY